MKNKTKLKRSIFIDYGKWHIGIALMYYCVKHDIGYTSYCCLCDYIKKEKK